MCKKTVALIVLDGFGYSEKVEGNATKLAHMPFYAHLVQTYANNLIRASGEFVGLKKGQMGNSETGHLNIGAGRVVKQDLTIIDDSINSGDFNKNQELTKFFSKNKNKILHVLGLMSNGGVHSHINHLFATLKMAKEYNVSNVFIHCFTDGRDTPVTSAINFIKEIQKQTRKIGIGEIATISGRFYAMDREKLYDRTQVCYNALVKGKGESFDNAVKAIKQSYNNNITDEFIKPIVITKNGKPLTTINKDDAVIFINFRKDRAKQLTDAFTNKNFEGFKTNFTVSNFLTFTNYGDNLKTQVAFNKQPYTNTLCEVISNNNMAIAKFAEPTKFPHVTYFLNGGRETPFNNEVWFKIPPKKVKTFDEAPQMSAIELAKTFEKEVKKNKYDFVMCNIANGDMVGHTGNLDATIKACETIDKSLQIIINHIKKINGEAIICADHGNAEQMIYKNKVCTTHSNNPVRVIYVNNNHKKYKVKKGALKDIAPTILNLLNLEKPKCYTGNNLVLTNEN